MKDIIIGLGVTTFVILFLEIFGKFNKKLMASYTLVGIPFIYVGFTWNHLPSLGMVVASVLFFLLLAYWGYKKNYLLIVIGLVLHGVWDVAFPFIGSGVPEGYDLFCITIDILLAIYFYFRIAQVERMLSNKKNEMINKIANY